MEAPLRLSVLLLLSGWRCGDRWPLGQAPAVDDAAGVAPAALDSWSGAMAAAGGRAVVCGVFLATEPTWAGLSLSEHPHQYLARDIKSSCIVCLNEFNAIFVSFAPWIRYAPSPSELFLFYSEGK